MPNDTHETASSQGATLEFVGRPPFAMVPKELVLDSSLSRDARLLYTTLASYAPNPFPGQQALAESMGASDRSIRNWMIELKEAGWVTWKKRGMSQTNLYRLFWERQVTGDENDTDRNEGSAPIRNEGSGLSGTWVPGNKKKITRKQNPPNPPSGGTSPSATKLRSTVAREQLEAMDNFVKAQAAKKPRKRRVKNAVKALDEHQKAIFEEWWRAYPVKKRRADAMRAWANAAEVGVDTAQLTTALDHYLESIAIWESKAQQKFTWHFAAPNFIDGQFLDFVDGPDPDRWSLPEVQKGSMDWG